ncbi:hypothetical protein LOD99_15113 [Oopsacas minuta]|uniref:Uncharacterized protein n=1 Tax=Oopsacas minuta TaxID=111878 RepID=A0AAV7KC52_9METZ|nr:hypothetical protein LOD99_15113 [Oopsacas minuta]
MASRDPQYVTGMSESSDSDQELMSSVISHTDSQVGVCSQQSLLSPSIFQSLVSLTFKTPANTLAPKRQRSVTGARRGGSKAINLQRNWVTNTMAGRKLKFQEKGRLTLRKVKVLSEDDKEIFEQVRPWKEIMWLI